MTLRDNKKVAHQRMVEIQKRHPERRFKLGKLYQHDIYGGSYHCDYYVSVRCKKRWWWFDSYDQVKDSL